MMMDLGMIIGDLMKMEKESPEKYVVIREEAKKVLEIFESYRKMHDERT